MKWCVSLGTTYLSLTFHELKRWRYGRNHCCFAASIYLDFKTHNNAATAHWLHVTVLYCVHVAVCAMIKSLQLLLSIFGVTFLIVENWFVFFVVQKRQTNKRLDYKVQTQPENVLCSRSTLDGTSELCRILCEVCVCIKKLTHKHLHRFIESVFSLCYENSLC